MNPHQEHPVKCPTCADTALVMSDRQGVEIDYCTQCRGVWLGPAPDCRATELSGAGGRAVPAGVRWKSGTEGNELINHSFC